MSEVNRLGGGRWLRVATALGVLSCLSFSGPNRSRMAPGWLTQGAVLDLRSNGLRPAGWTSADATGLPILPGLVRYDEVAGGEIRHAVHLTVPRTRRESVWPACHFASRSSDSGLPPMSQRFRLRKDHDIAGFPPGVEVILRAVKKCAAVSELGPEPVARGPVQ